jgi:RimJ/RimL family protein N-acetyltransferase
MTSTILRSERLVLAPYDPSDEEDFVDLFQDHRVSRWMGDGPSTEAADRALFGRIFSKVYDQDLFDVWAVRQPHDSRYIGHAEVKPTAVSGGHEIIYMLAHDVWGAGLGRELAGTLVEHAFDALGLTEVHATVAAPNAASLAVLRAVGFTKVRDIAEKDGSTTVFLTRRQLSDEA